MSTPTLGSKFDVVNMSVVAEFGMERYRKIVADNPNASPNDLFDLLMKAIKAWRAASRPAFNDDDPEDEAGGEIGFSDDDSEDEDEAGGEIGKQLGDESKPGTVKRHIAPVEGELECKKPRTGEGSAPQGEEPESGGSTDSSQ